jgi:hypothetical protein
VETVFRRPGTATDEAARTTTSPHGDTTTAPDDTSAGKGKATPKRRDAQARRRSSVINQGGSGRTRGRESREQIAARRAALKRGDESALPARDRGPVRRFVRDFVDARRSPATYFMPVGLPIFLLSYTAIWVFQLLSYLVILALITDGVLITRRIRREVAARFPKESTKGLGLYALTRAVQLRRLRIPGPRVSPGDKI